VNFWFFVKNSKKKLKSALLGGLLNPKQIFLGLLMLQLSGTYQFFKYRSNDNSQQPAEWTWKKETEI
jgi:hypothetical protein